MSRDPQAALATVHRYFTPYALALVTVALIVSRPAGIYAAVSYIVLAFAAVFNVATEKRARRADDVLRIRDLRLGVNLMVNAFLVFLLLPYWRPIWLLFALTPIATAVYETQKRTLQMALGIAVLLVWGYWVAQLRTTPLAAEAFIHAGFIVFVSLFVNKVVREAGADAAAR